MLTTSAIVTVNTRFIITWIRCSIFGLSGPWKGLGTIPIPCTYKVCVLPVPTACSLGCAVMQRLLRWVDHVMRMSSNCLPGLDVFYMDSSPTASTCLEDQRSASLIIWKPFWRNVAFRLTNWRSWQWTGLRGEMPVRLVFQYRWPTSTRLQRRTVVHAGMRSPTRSKWSMLSYMQQSLCFWLRS